MSKGLLISIEGPDGAGKTTVLEALLPRLREVYPAQVVTTREPGGVAIAEQIREVILDVDNTAMDAKTELLLYIAARRQHLVEKVLPELEKGNMVIMDRFIDSSVAYQGTGRGLNQNELQSWLPLPYPSSFVLINGRLMGSCLSITFFSIPGTLK